MLILLEAVHEYPLHVESWIFLFLFGLIGSFCVRNVDNLWRATPIITGIGIGVIFLIGRYDDKGVFGCGFWDAVCGSYDLCLVIKHGYRVALALRCHGCWKWGV